MEPGSDQRVVGSRTLAWRALGADEGDGPQRLKLATPRLDGGQPDRSRPGPGLDALLAASASVAAADLGVGDPLVGLDAAAREQCRRVALYVDAAWATDLGLASDSPLLQRLGSVGSQLDPPPGIEAAFGAALARALERGISRGCIDVSLLREAAGPLEELLAALPAWGDGLVPRLVLDTDVLQLVRVAWRLLHVSHQTWFAAHNREVAGEPRHVLHHPVEAWARQLPRTAAAVVERLHVRRSFEGSDDDIRHLVKQHFTWAADADREGFATWLDCTISGPVQTILALVDPGASELAALLEPHLPELEDESDVLDVTDTVTGYLEAWLQTDAGLLARLHRELQVAADTWQWRRTRVPAADTQWCVADVSEAATTAAAALDASELVAGRESA